MKALLATILLLSVVTMAQETDQYGKAVWLKSKIHARMWKKQEIADKFDEIIREAVEKKDMTNYLREIDVAINKEKYEFFSSGEEFKVIEKKEKSVKVKFRKHPGVWYISLIKLDDVLNGKSWITKAQK